MEILITLVIEIIFGACSLWVAAKVTHVDATFLNMLAVAAASSVAGLVPLVGPLLGLVVMFLLIRKLTDADIWPDAVLMVVVSWIVSLLAGMFLVGLVAGVSTTLTE
ncbi:MAG: hypothetical protein Q8P51_14690 [Ignavibacteria bacterium]|nr:hypothetical protein [Ignavibacteria bacterium]